jgi:hypothetical protein
MTTADVVGFAVAVLRGSPCPQPSHDRAERPEAPAL